MPGDDFVQLAEIPPLQILLPVLPVFSYQYTRAENDPMTALQIKKLLFEMSTSFETFA